MSDPANEAPEPLNIKKYPNRRYYDATRSRHVTLEEIYGLIRQGHQVQVTDSKTGEDITAKLLAQIIIELDPLKLGVFPIPLLHGLLRSNEQPVTELARRYFEQFLGVFLTSQKDLGGYFGRMIGLRGQAPTFADWARMMWGPLGVVPPGPQGGPLGQAPAAQSPPVEPQAPAAENGLGEQVESLRAQLEALQKKLAGSKPKRPPRRPGKSPK
jgi:polyhydroxyalkanoate synthesis repressor PhaR